MQKRWKWFLFGLLALLALEVLYVLTGNWALRSGTAARLISRKPERLQVEWVRGWTYWPGLVHLEGVRVRGQSERTQSYIQVEKCALRINPFLLLACRVQFALVEGEGLSLWVRHRREPGNVRPLDRYEPPVPGLAQDAPPPYRKPYPSPWTLHFGSVKVTHVREIWIGPYRTIGEGSAEGALSYRLRGPLSVDRALLRMEGSKTSVGEEVIASDVQAVLDAAIARVVPRENRGRPFLKYISGRFQVRGQVGTLGFLNEALGRQSALSFKGRGALSTDFTLRRGVIGPRSSISWEGQDLVASGATFGARGRGSLSGGTQEDGPEVSLVARWSGITITGEGLPPIALDGPGLTVTISGPRLDLAAEKGELTLSLDLPDSGVRDLAALASFLPPKVPLSILPGSAARVKGHLELVGPKARGSLSISGRDIGVGLGAQRLRGIFFADLPVEDGDLMAKRFTISGSKAGFRSATLTDASGKVKGAPWSGHVALSDATLHLTMPARLEAKATLAMDDTRPVVAALAEQSKAVRWFKGVLEIRDVKGSAALESRKGMTAVRDVDIEGDGLQMLAQMVFREGRSDCAVYVQLHGLSTAVSLAGSKRDWKLVGARKWYDERSAEMRKTDLEGLRR